MPSFCDQMGTFVVWKQLRIWNEKLKYIWRDYFYSTTACQLWVRHWEYCCIGMIRELKNDCLYWSKNLDWVICIACQSKWRTITNIDVTSTKEVCSFNGRIHQFTAMLLRRTSSFLCKDGQLVGMVSKVSTDAIFLCIE